jgi:phenylalanyl-tRNA synthetase alpha subunit
MPTGLPSTIKTLVIQQWLQGRPRNDIASENGVSSGAVTNIVNEWRHDLGFAAADELRELAVTMRKVGINAAQCALGFRIATVMLRIGVKEDSFESFILDVYNRCKDIGLSPENISSYLADLLGFSKTVLPLSKIPDYIKEKTNEKGKLGEEIEKLNVQIETLQEQKKDAESLRDIALQDEKMTSSGLKWYTDLREELRKYGIPIGDIQQFAKTMKGVKQLNYDVDFMITSVTNFQAFGAMQAKLQEDVNSLTITKHDLEEECDRLEEVVSIHSQTAEQAQELKKQGFSFKDLKKLSYKIKEIAAANNIHENLAVKKFITDIDQQYDNKLGFESEVEKLKSQILKNESDRTLYATATAFLNSVIIQQQHYIIQLNEQIKKNGVLGEFGPLIKEAEGENVPVNELKFALIKAIELVVRALHPTDNTVNILNSAKMALGNTLNDII